MEWNDETITRLRALWAEGLSSAEIGRRMGISKNAVVGKAGRLDLPPRTSPIRKLADGQPRKVYTKRQPTPGLTLPQGGQSLRGNTLAALRVMPQRRDAAALATIFNARPAADCQWPTSNGKPWTFCCATAAPGRSYCSEHAGLAYVRFKAFLAIEPKDLRLVAEDMQIDGAKTTPLTDLLAEVNRRRSARGQSEFFLPGMPERRPSFGAAANA